MAALETPAGELGWHAEDFTLKDAYGNPIRLHDLKGPSGTLVMFICNYCATCARSPTAIVRDARDLQKRGIGVIAVMPNDYVRHPDDAPKQMKRFAKEHDFSFPTSSTRCRRWCARSRGGTAGSAPPISVANNLPPIKLAPPTAHCIAFRPTRSAPSSV